MAKFLGVSFAGIVVRMRVGRVLLLAGLVLAALPASSALATTIGQTGAPSTTDRWSGGDELLPQASAVPDAGLVTSFQTQASDCSQTGGVPGIFNFQVLRPEGGNQYLVVGDTGNQTDSCNSQLNSYPVNIAVQGGDVLGVYVVQNWQGLLSFTGGVQFGFQSEPSVGQTITVPNQFAATVDESATFVIPTKLKATPAVARLLPTHLYLFNVNATLTTAGGGPISGQTIVFTASGSHICSAVTNSAGTASCEGTVSVVSILLSNGYKATFDGNDPYLSSSAKASLISLF
jgi:hypothetical protein